MDKELDKLNKELEQAKKLAEERLNSWKRAAADFENYKKRKVKEDQALVAFAKEMSVMRLLPVLESLEGALKQAPQDDKYKEWQLGVNKITEEITKAMKDLGVEKIKTVGEKYDHSLHEAV